MARFVFTKNCFPLSPSICTNALTTCLPLQVRTDSYEVRQRKRMAKNNKRKGRSHPESTFYISVRFFFTLLLLLPNTKTFTTDVLLLVVVVHYRSNAKFGKSGKRYNSAVSSRGIAARVTHNVYIASNFTACPDTNWRILSPHNQVYIMRIGGR